MARSGDSSSIGCRSDNSREGTRRFVELGLETSLVKQPGGGRKQRCLDGKLEAHLTALVCSDAPNGRARWTLRLLADQMVQLGYVESYQFKLTKGQMN